MLKSTEIVIEQLIIGLLFFVIVVLFAWGNPLSLLNSGGDAYQSFFFGVLVVIAAYAAGIVVDRWSDTLLEQLERRIRIQVYLKSITYCQFFWSNIFSLPKEPSLRLEIQEKDGGIADYHDYLRRRMRITRAITCLMPALFLAMALHDYQCESQVVVRHIAGGITFLLYAAFLAYSIFLRRILCAILWCFKRRFMLEEYLVPTTHDAKSLAVYVGSHSPKRILYHNKIRIGFRFIDLTNPAILGLMIFTILGMMLLVCLYFSNSPINPVRIFFRIPLPALS